MSYALRTATKSRLDAEQRWRKNQGSSLAEEPLEIEAKVWKFPQAVIHHQFDLVSGTAVWIVTSCRIQMEGAWQSATWEEYLCPLLQQLVPAQVFSSPRIAFETSLQIHLRLARWSLGDWTQLLERDETKIQDLVRNISWQSSLNAASNSDLRNFTPY